MERNKKCLLILGPSGSGKSASLRNLVDHYGNKVAWLDWDGKLAPPFKGGKSKIKKWITPADPMEMMPGALALEADPDIEYIVVDTLSHWLRILEQKYVIESADSRGAWGKVYQAQIGSLMHHANNVSKKTWIFISHVTEGDIENYKTQIKAFVKGSTKSIGIESWFNVVVYTNVIDDDESETGVKYRFQVQKTKDTTNLSVKSPMGMFDGPYTEDNDVEIILKAIEDYE